MAGIANLKPWPKGVSGNPQGTVKLPPELKAIRALTGHETARLIAKYARMPLDQIEITLKNPTTPALEAAICSIFNQAHKKGDWLRLAFLLDRALGKVTDVPPDIQENDNPEFEKIRAMPIRDALKYIESKLPEE